MKLFSQICKSKARLDGKTVLVTGANTGIGKETVRDLYWRGARVILACRNLDKANEAVEDVKTTPPSRPEREQFRGKPGELLVSKLDLNSLESVRECAKHVVATEPVLHILVNNAGVMMCPYGKTEDGFETQFGVNHLGHFLLTLLLLPKLRASGPGCRIVNVASVAYFTTTLSFDNLNAEKSYNSITAYGRSKLANILFTRDLARRLKEAGIDGITVYCLHPGVITTELVRHVDKTIFWGAQFLFLRVLGLFIKSPERGAQTTLHCVLDEEAGKESGLYYTECSVRTPWPRCRDDAKAARLWEESLKFVGLQPNENLAEMLNRIESEQSKIFPASN